MPDFAPSVHPPSFDYDDPVYVAAATAVKAHLPSHPRSLHAPLRNGVRVGAAGGGGRTASGRRPSRGCSGCA